jgi:hypothetical protein
MDPDEIAEKVSSFVSQHCKDMSVEDYAEVLEASIEMLRSDLAAARDE